MLNISNHYMAGKKYDLDDFKIGDSVISLTQKELTFVVIDIDKENGLLVCGIPRMPDVKGKFKPEELEKENILRPPNIVDFNISEGE
jgi:hypothetical protein